MSRLLEVVAGRAVGEEKPEKSDGDRQQDNVQHCDLTSERLYRALAQGRQTLVELGGTGALWNMQPRPLIRSDFQMNSHKGSR
jgi:hypothetical protein